MANNGVIGRVIDAVTKQGIDGLTIKAYDIDPFASETQIEFQAGREGHAHAEIWNLAGRRMRSIDLGSVPRGVTRFSCSCS